MDKFLTFPNSRIPIWQDDLAFIQNDAQKGLSLAIQSMLPPAMRSAPKVILFGCKVSDFSGEVDHVYTYSYRIDSPGLIMIDGELLEVPQMSATETFECVPTFVVDTEYEPAGDRLDADGNTRRCYALRRAKLAVGENNDIFHKIPRFSQKLDLGFYDPGDSGGSMMELNVVNGVNYIEFAADGLGLDVHNQADGETLMFHDIWNESDSKWYWPIYTALFAGYAGAIIERDFSVYIRELNALLPARLELFSADGYMEFKAFICAEVTYQTPVHIRTTKFIL